METPTTFRFMCQKCGLCCHSKGHTTLTYKDIGRISKHLGISIDNFVRDYTYLLKRILLDHNNEKVGDYFEICLNRENGKCIFVSQNICTIHNDKPLFCRSFPFIGSEEYFWNQLKEQTYCKGFGKGRAYSISEIKDKLNSFRSDYLRENKEILEARMDLSLLLPTLPKVLHSQTVQVSNSLLF